LLLLRLALLRTVRKVITSDVGSDDARGEPSNPTTGSDQEGDDMSATLAPPPPPTKAPPTVALNVRIEVEFDTAIREYAAENNSTVKAVVNQALSEYLTRRNRHPDQPRKH
jgi:hypothetical protein